MSGYVAIGKDLREDPRTLRLADVYGAHLFGDASPENCDASLDATVGLLHRLWTYADTHIRDDDTIAVTLSQVARVLRIPLEVLRAVPSDWLVEQPDGTILLPEYRERNGLISREVRREKTRERMRKLRERRAAKTPGSATSAASAGADSRDASRAAHGDAGDAPNPTQPNPLSKRRVNAWESRDVNSEEAKAEHRRRQREEIGRLEVEYTRAGFRTALPHETPRSYRTAFEQAQREHRVNGSGGLHA